ncbi:hypothetical protein EIP86_005329, partial [Pleurotus ostreatoroseus]
SPFELSQSSPFKSSQTSKSSTVKSTVFTSAATKPVLRDISVGPSTKPSEPQAPDGRTGPRVYSAEVTPSPDPSSRKAIYDPELFGIYPSDYEDLVGDNESVGDVESVNDNDSAVPVAATVLDVKGKDKDLPGAKRTFEMYNGEEREVYVVDSDDEPPRKRSRSAPKIHVRVIVWICADVTDQFSQELSALCKFFTSRDIAIANALRRLDMDLDVWSPDRGKWVPLTVDSQFRTGLNNTVLLRNSKLHDEVLTGFWEEAARLE